jgi:hypothetical protein
MSGLFERLRWERQERRERQGGLTPWTFGVYADSQYLEIFERALAREKGDILGRRKRFWTMLQFLELTRDLDGETAEVGVLFGLSSYLICSYRQLREHGFKGAGHHAIDSYRGFARAHPADLQPGACELIFSLDEQRPRNGSFRGRAEQVMASFPEIEFHEGWIPEVFDTLDSDARYRFVHVDVDLHDPTYDSLAYFYPRVVPGGAIVIDDYGFREWPGCRTATDAFCDRYGAAVLPLPHGNAAIFKRG